MKAKMITRINPTERKIQAPIIKKSKLEEILNFQMKALKISGFQREYKFHPKRKWRFDFANPEKKIAIECEGGIYTNGRHVRGSGYENDCQKYNEASIMGWKLIRVTGSMVKKGTAIDYVEKAIKE